MPDLAVRTRDLTRRFETVVAVNGIDLEIEAGTIFGFLGPNGAGKTTTIRLLLGLLEPTTGDAEVLGYGTRRDAGEIRLRTGALLEHSGLYERLTAYENLDLFGRIWRLSKAERRARIEELLAHFGLWERRDEQAGKWSRGMKQKLAVARTLIHRPRLIFLDEPTAGLDPMAAAALRDDLAQLAAQEHVTVFLTTHNLNEAERLCHQVGVIRGGQLIALGHPDEIRDRSAHPRVTVTGEGITEAVVQGVQALARVTAAQVNGEGLVVDFEPDADTTALVTMLVGEGVRIEEVRKRKDTLEETFLKLMQEEPDVPEVST